MPIIPINRIELSFNGILGWIVGVSPKIRKLGQFDQGPQRGGHLRAHNQSPLVGKKRCSHLDHVYVHQNSQTKYNQTNLGGAHLVGKDVVVVAIHRGLLLGSTKGKTWGNNWLHLPTHTPQVNKPITSRSQPTISLSIGTLSHGSEGLDQSTLLVEKKGSKKLTQPKEDYQVSCRLIGHGWLLGNLPFKPKTLGRLGFRQIGSQNQLTHN